MADKGSIFDLSLDRITRVQELNDWILSQIKRENRNLTINVKPGRTYSNVCAPVAGVIHYYKERGINISIKCERKSYEERTRFWTPVSIENCSDSEKYYPFNKVWTFSSDQGVYNLVSALVLELRKSDIVEAGVIDSVEWCLTEVMDNVLQHSGSDMGFVMAQIHKHSKIFAFCVFDTGIGFYNSLKGTKYHPQKAIDAITLALQEKVTRDESSGQGNGLWGLSSIVAQSHGTITVSSGGAMYKLLEQTPITKEGGFVLSRQKGTAYVDVQLNYNKELNIADALTGSEGPRYTPVDLWLESLEDDHDQYQVKICDLSGGTGTRRSAEKLRNLVLNISNNEHKVVVLDFQEVNLISSSFADELVGKIVAEKGFVYFLKAFKIENLNELNAKILNRSVEQRMAQIYLRDATT